MLQVIQSPFLHALGYAIINSLWQFALLWLIYVSLHTVFKLSSHQKYVTGLLIQLTGFAWFSLTFINYLRKFVQLEEIHFLEQKPISLTFTIGKSFSLRESILKGVEHTNVLLPYLSIAYLAIVILLCLKWIRAYNITYTVRNKGLHEIDSNWKLFVKRLSQQLGIRRDVKIYLSEMVTSPLTIGFLKPVILVPLASLNSLNMHQMEAVILHELAHIKRFDYLYNVLLACVDIALFFNPFAMLIGKYVKRERENCCDDWVLQYEYNPALYASALLQIAVCQTKTSLLTMQAADNRNVLLTRIKRMIEKNEKTFFNYRYQLIALFVMLSVVTSLALLSSWHNMNRSSTSSVTRQVVSKHMVETVNNPLYNPEFFIAGEQPKDPDIKKPAEKILRKAEVFNASIYKTTTNSSNPDNKQPEKVKQQKALPMDRQPALAKKGMKAPVSPRSPELLNYKEHGADDITNAALFEAVTMKESDMELAQEHFKELAKAFVIAGEPSLDQTQTVAHINTAVAEIKNIKIQFNYKKFYKLAIEQNKQLKALRQKALSASCKSGELARVTKKLLLEAAKAEQGKKLAEMNFQFNTNIDVPTMRFVPAPPQHNFSFDVSAQPKVRPVIPASLHRIKRDKKASEVLLERRDCSHENRNNERPSFMGEENRSNIVVIKI